ncbi:unnamed protein product [Vitrella brassicaformis CCMP3155]|uniref:FAS1 domain-containing protein n=1 Tax=Vitrella brassicaformis (strain CCMP3155) TaxID=1169540 RepID=A0A0G4ENI5_VITBC|nr:unnamed protein product [Vitrella brassicaformis CCMP3155]|mmetsp:Transcript_34521/g.85547  ORF Transcript_34521/g.85547 Transcript_34521/m.85547 type:complete len:614 (-) Transcript_34521:338-2179(-)|eukprot:CEL98534.1 unnamed protein product [Vitrella brassicaformis CCMP3155]
MRGVWALVTLAAWLATACGDPYSYLAPREGAMDLSQFPSDCGTACQGERALQAKGEEAESATEGAKESAKESGKEAATSAKDGAKESAKESDVSAKESAKGAKESAKDAKGGAVSPAGREEEEEPTEGLLNIFATRESLSELNDLAERQNLVPQLVGLALDRQVNVFAPTNEAFTSGLPPAFQSIFSNPLQADTVEKILNYHIVAGERLNLADFQPGTGFVVRTENNQSLAISAEMPKDSAALEFTGRRRRRQLQDGEGGVLPPVGDQAAAGDSEGDEADSTERLTLKVNSFGLTADVLKVIPGVEGTVIETDKILLPQFHDGVPTLIDWLRARPEYSRLARLASLADLTDLLPGANVANAGPLTVVVARDSGMVIPEGTSDPNAIPGDPLPLCLLDALVKPENKDALRKVFDKIIIAGVWNQTLLAQTSTLPNLGNQGLPVEQRGSHFYIDGKKIIESDIKIANGIIHVVDQFPVPLDIDAIDVAFWTCMDQGLRFLKPEWVRLGLSFLDQDKSLPVIGRAPGQRPAWVASDLPYYYPPLPEFPASKRDIPSTKELESQLRPRFSDIGNGHGHSYSKGHDHDGHSKGHDHGGHDKGHEHGGHDKGQPHKKGY